MKKNQKRINKTKNLIGLSTKANIDTKLTQTALLLEYSFGFKVDFKNRIITISGDIDQEQFEIVEAGLTEMESQSRAGVTIKINSSGGEVYQALAIVGRLKESKCKITTKGYGHIMSAATMILAAGDSRKISRHSFFMHHEASYALEGKHSHLKNEVKQAEKEERFWAEWMTEYSTAPKNFWATNGVGVNAYFTAQELLDLGVVDEIF